MGLKNMARTSVSIWLWIISLEFICRGKSWPLEFELII